MTIPGIKIFKAKKVITMNSYCPYGTHVAVKEGKILGVGSLEQLEGWGRDADLTLSASVFLAQRNGFQIQVQHFQRC